MKRAWIFSLGWLHVAHAQSFGGGGGQSITLTNPLGQNASFSSVMASIISFIFFDVAIPVCVIMVLVGAFQMMTAAGDPEKFSKGRKTIFYAAIGFAIALIAGGLASLIQSIISPS